MPATLSMSFYRLEQPSAVTVTPARLLLLGEELWLKTAGLTGRLAPETASSLSVALIQLEPDCPKTPAHLPQIEFSPCVINRESDYRHRTVEALRDYCRSLLNTVEADPSASCPTAPRQKLDELGLRTNLWSLNRATTRAIVEYAKLSRADSSLAQPSTAHRELQFLQLLLSACIDEVSLTLDAFLPAVLRTRLFKAFESNERILDAKVHRGVPPALLCLIVQGSMPQHEFEMFVGLNSESSKIEVVKLKALGILAVSKAKRGWVEPALPGWLAACLLPQLEELLLTSVDGSKRKITPNAGHSNP
ncbi:hypothetical protein OKW98_15395 [Pseudomonas sp. KU26590]|uniref:hypothetical protein n=1 Tax=Pseudomonas sp. KU26590 TaxID=2991051 RepID=UPI00223D550A|nr:hypothetical protein [Pseudomonas sp. KU26590]UZJ58005.1 hypothetical protein OKW98_15395 [Pseudomonas sp. KU26590]